MDEDDDEDDMVFFLSFPINPISLLLPLLLPLLLCYAHSALHEEDSLFSPLGTKGD
jgi:hypothetical protein